ncbi:MAG: tRNA-dihydrouridine synthase family protein [Clostridia bacterium]|nr:tRNA-dihydrouridine synthase family protein [Clostridia bacterium]
MDIRSAPLESLTDAVFRRVHHQLFGGVEKYYIPFVSPTSHHCFSPRERRDIAPENNEGVPVVPQIMTRYPEHFLWAAQEMQARGYDEVNLNIGCPSGTVTAKGKGAGMLREPEALRAFLDEIFAHSPLPISIKTRIGFAAPEEWDALLDILRQYPMKELIIHPRLRVQFYKGDVHPEAFRLAAQAGLPLVYNGDLFDLPTCQALQTDYPLMPMMLGRGLLANPAMPRQLGGGAALTVEEIARYHDALEQKYSRIFPKDQVHCKMRGLMKHVACCFERPEKMMKLIAKTNPYTYHAAVEKLLQAPLREAPGFVP